MRAIHVPAGRSGLDYFCVGPVWATPHPNPAGPPSGWICRYAAEAVRAADEERVGGLLLPWFAISRDDLTNVEQVAAAGAERIVVVRAITEAPDPEAAAAELLEALDAGAENAGVEGTSAPVAGLNSPLQTELHHPRGNGSWRAGGEAAHPLPGRGVVSTAVRFSDQLGQEGVFIAHALCLRERLPRSRRPHNASREASRGSSARATLNLSRRTAAALPRRTGSAE